MLNRRTFEIGRDSLHQLRVLLAMLSLHNSHALLQNLPFTHLSQDQPVTLFLIAMGASERGPFVGLNGFAVGPGETIEQPAKAFVETIGSSFGFVDPALCLLLIKVGPLFSLRQDECCTFFDERLHVLCIFIFDLLNIIMNLFRFLMTKH